VRRLYISNSKYLFLTIVFCVLCGLALTESYYNYKNVPADFGNAQFKRMKLPVNSRKTIVYLGDSRSNAGIVPAVLNEKIKGYTAFNAGAKGGNIFELIDYVKSLNKDFGLIIVVVSPSSVFGAFVHDTVETVKNKISLSFIENGSLFNRIETDIMETHMRNFKFLYGYTELKNVFFYGEISHYFTPDRWESDTHFGSSVNFSRAYNYYGYKLRNLCNSGNLEFLNATKIKFSSYINDLKKTHMVLLVRLPISKELKKLEDERFPWFDDFILSTAENNKIKYLYNFSESLLSDPNNDGSHLSHHQAIRFSESFADSLNLYLNN
jgi:hypothetical protein